jgi:hypothetical protein
MLLLITKEEAIALLNQNRKHYLWNKEMSRWTAQDVENLRNGININVGNILREKTKPAPYLVKETKVSSKRTMNRSGQPILVTTPEGIETTFESIVQASAATGIKAHTIYTLVNGRYAQSFGYSFKKI